MLEALKRFRRTELGGLIGDSSYVGVGYAAVAVAELVQIALVTRTLGLMAYGQLALAISVVTLCGRFFNVRVGTVTTVFGAKRMQADVGGARGVFQFGYLISGVAGVLSATVVAIVAVLAGESLIGDHGATLLLLYGGTLLTSTFQDPGSAILRLLGRFRIVAGYTVALQIVRVALVATAAIVLESLTAVVGALVIIDGLTSIAEVSAAAIAFRRASGGVRLTDPGMQETREERRGMLGMIWHTNIAEYGGLAQTQLPTVLIGALGGPTTAGVYKLGMAGATGLASVVDPLYGSILPRLARLWQQGRVSEVRRLIRHTSWLSVPTMVVLGFLLLVPLRTPLLTALGGKEAIAAGAGSVLLFGVIGRGVSSALFWNRPILWAMGRSRAVAQLTVVTTFLQLALLVLLVPSMDATGGAVALCVTALALNAAQTLLALRFMRSEAELARESKASAS